MPAVALFGAALSEHTAVIRSSSSPYSPSTSHRRLVVFVHSDSTPDSQQLPLPTHTFDADAAAPPNSSSSPPQPLSFSSHFCRLPFALIGECVSSWWYNGTPQLAYSRRIFLRLRTPLVLRCVHVFQLFIHLSFLVTAVALLAHRSAIGELLPADSEANTAWRILQALPAWLLARSVISAVLSARRVRLNDKWTNSRWEAAWCVLVSWASTGVVAGASLLALSELPEANDVVCLALWVLVSVLLLQLTAHIASFCLMLLFFPMAALTVNTPIVPIAQHYWDDAEESKPQRNEGLTPDQLQALPLSAYEGGRDDACCAVCMDDVAVGDMQRELRCGHCYHQACIDRWLLKKRSCPLCVRAVRVSSRSSSEGAVELSQLAKAPRRPAAVETEQAV